MARILLVDDHRITRQGLRALLDHHTEMQIVGEAGDGREAIHQAAKLSPDVVIMDVAMPCLNGIEATRQIVAANSKVRVLILTMHADRRFIQETLRTGARGYLLKICAYEELVTAIQTVMEGKPYLSPSITNIVLTDYLQHVSHPSDSAFTMLTPREREVLQLIVEGHCNREIADMLHISIKTVDAHRQQVMTKLDKHNVTELIRYALREGIISLETSQ